MAVHLRQICLVARDLAPAIDALRDRLNLPVAHVDGAVGKYGLENTLLTAGTQFLEVVAPIRDDTAAGRFLDRRGGDGGYMVICQADSAEAQTQVRENARRAGVREAHFADRGDWNICQFHPGDMGAAFLEVDWDTDCDVTGRWMPAGTDWTPGADGEGIPWVELQSDDPAALAARWAAVLGVSVGGSDATPTVALANAELRFVRAQDGRGAGLSGLGVRLPGAEAGTAAICGTRFEIEG